MSSIINKTKWSISLLAIPLRFMSNPIILFVILFAFSSLIVYSQVDSTIPRPINVRVGIGIFSLPGIYAEKNIFKEISAEAGIISCIFLSEASIGLKYHILGKNNFKIKAGIGCGMTAYFWWAKTDPPKSGKDIFLLPVIPIEFVYKRFSLELQPGYPFKISGDDDTRIPIIVFLSYFIHR